MSSDRVTLQVTERPVDQLGSRRVRRLRREGMVPGVLYGKGHAARSSSASASSGPRSPGRRAPCDRRRRDRRADDAAPRGPQGVPAAPDQGNAHARRLPRGPPRPARSRRRSASTSSASRPARSRAASSSRSRASCASRRCHRDPRAHRGRHQRLEIGDDCGSRTSPRSRASRSSTIPRPSSRPARSRVGHRARGGRGRRGRGGRGRGRGRGAEGEASAEAAGEGAGPTRSKPCASSVGAKPPRRSTCSSSGSATPGREHARDRHNVGWMVVDELARRHGGRSRSSSAGGSPRCASGSALALLKPETYMNESGASIQAAAAFFKVAPDHLARRARRGRPRRRPSPGAARAAGSPATTGSARSRSALGIAGVPAAPDRRRAARPRRPAPGRRLRALAVRARGRPRAIVYARRRRRRVAPRAKASRRPSGASTDAASAATCRSHVMRLVR